MPRNNWSFSKTGGQANWIKRIRAERLADLKGLLVGRSPESLLT